MRTGVWSWSASTGICREEKRIRPPPHGGNDPGKVGVDQSLEKDINLAISKKLARYLELADVEVVMTRSEDKGLYSETDSRKKSADMKARCSLIDEAEPDLVVSIHQNSYHEENVSGGQVFYYNGSVKGKKLAEILQKRFDYVLGEKNTRQAKANDSYYLLLHVKSPIVIVECGFLSTIEGGGPINIRTSTALAWSNTWRGNYGVSEPALEDGSFRQSSTSDFSIRSAAMEPAGRT